MHYRESKTIIPKELFQAGALVFFAIISVIVVLDVKYDLLVYPFLLDRCKDMSRSIARLLSGGGAFLFYFIIWCVVVFKVRKHADMPGLREELHSMKGDNLFEKMKNSYTTEKTKLHQEKNAKQRSYYGKMSLVSALIAGVCSVAFGIAYSIMGKFYFKIAVVGIIAFGLFMYYFVKWLRNKKK